jgi:hypothetical protein
MTCISTLPAYQTGYHLYDLRPEILVNPYQSAQVSSYSYTTDAVVCLLRHAHFVPRWPWPVNYFTSRSVSSLKYHFR